MDDQLFVKIEEYNEVLNIVKVVKGKISNAKETINKISEIKAQEDEEIAMWNKNLFTISKNVEEIEKAFGYTKNK